MNLVQAVETHIRVASHLESVEIASTNTAMRFLTPGAPKDAFNATRVHRLDSHNNVDFYIDVIRKSVVNAHAGQSTTFLVCGPPSSGRSQTLYGTATEKGIIELAAEDVLKLNGVVATFSGYHCRGSTITDTVTRSPVTVLAHAPPMGTTAIAHMRELTSAKEAVLVPQRKAPDHTCVVSFQLYRPIDGEPRRDMYATINFVDLAAFGTPTPADVQALSNSLERLESGGDPGYSACVLTRLMEPWLVGATTLVAIGTVSGKPQLLEPSVAALRFLRQLSRLNQVVTLIQMHVPRQLREAILEHERNCADEKAMVQSAYDRGLFDAYEAARSFLHQRCGTDSAFDGLLTDLAVARRAQQGQTTDELSFLQREIETSRNAEKTSRQTAQQAHDRNRQLAALLAQERDENMRLDIELNAIQNNCDCFVSECELKISEMSAEGTKRRRAVEAAQKDSASYRDERRQLKIRSDKLLDEVQTRNRLMVLMTHRDELRQKRKRLEEQLAKASEDVSERHEREREDRLRKSKAQRLTNAAVRVQCLRDNVMTRESQMMTASSEPSTPLSSLRTNMGQYHHSPSTPL